MIGKQQVMHIHGGSAYNSYEQYLENLKKWDFRLDESLRLKRWNRNYKKFLDEDVYEIISPVMPSKKNAKYLEWKIWFEKGIPLIKDDVILVGHSLGGTFLAKWLSENLLPVNITQIHLIAPVYDHESPAYQLDDFKITDFPKNLFENKIHEIHIYHSFDDTVVSIEESHKYYEALPGAHIHMFTDRFHFIDETFPELFENIKSVQNKKTC